MKPFPQSKPARPPSAAPSARRRGGRALVVPRRGNPDQVPLFADPDLDPGDATASHVAKDTMDSGVEDLTEHALRLTRAKICRVVKRLEEVGLPSPGEQIRIVTLRMFHALAFLEYIVAREPVVDLKLVVYSIGYGVAASLVRMLADGRVARAEILVSDLRNTAHQEKDRAVRDLFAGHPQIDLWFANSHAKVMSCRTVAGSCYTVEGSGNLSRNSRIEQYVIDNDPALYAFTCDWMRDVRAHLATRAAANEKAAARHD